MEQQRLASYVRSNGDYYNAMVRAGWIMPTISSAIVTRDFMDGIRRNEYYCPHVKQNIPTMNVANPPPKKELLKIWKKAVYQRVEEEPQNDKRWNAMLCTINLIEKSGKTPDNDWLIKVLSDVPGPNCEIF